ncbi:MAG: hypothetical protein CW345_08415 [Firmicutes bacterium]|nr:hypothetical protein [Bacillota bacterium]MBO2521810.1 hypothetical protein [Bacillota bacterium]
MSKSRSERNPRARSAGPRRSAAGRARASGSGPRKVSPGTLVALAAIVLAVAALLVYSSTQNRLHPALARAVERYPSEGANHVPTGQRVAYKTDPPNSGPHYAQWAPPGFYERPLPDELLVHNLEHGHIIIHYRPDALTPEIEQKILALTRAWTHQWAAVLAVPRPGMEHPFVLAAWRHLLRLDAYDDELVHLFVDAFIGRGPENPIR